MLKHHLTVLALLVLSILLVQAQAKQNLDITAQRLIDSTTQFVTSVTTFEITNTGKANWKSFDFAVASKNLSYKEFALTKDGNRQNATVLETTKETHNNIEYNIFKVEVDILPGESVTVSGSVIHSHVLTALPKEITQNEHQLMVLNFNLYVPSPYEIESQVTEVRVQNIVLYSTDLEPVSSPENGLVRFGTYKDIAPWSHHDGKVHHQNNAPFLTITKLVKEIEVSHWGNIAVEESVWLQHDGAHLRGGFSRLDLMNGAYGNGVHQFTEWLPHGANEVYYRDVIGNISSSNVFPHSEGVKFEIRPRFILFGGWKTEFYTGHNLPASQYITLDENSRHFIQLPLVNHYEHIVINEMQVRVILPEGAHSIKIHSDFPLGDFEETLRYTYLDTEGRPEIRFQVSNLVPVHHRFTLDISYDFHKSYLIQEPLLLIGGFFALFLLAIVFFRLNLAISAESSITDSVLEALGVEFRTLVQARDEEIELALSKSKNVEITRLKNIAAGYASKMKTLINQISVAKANHLANEIREFERTFEQKFNFIVTRLNLEAVRVPDTKKISKVIDDIDALTDELTNHFEEIVANF